MTLAAGNGPTADCRSRPALIPITLAHRQQLAGQYVQLARRDARSAGAGCAAWPAAPGCSSSSSPRSGSALTIVKEMSCP
jgi:hypothetical protein